MHQVNLIKLCLASSLYPNVAIADGANVNRKVSEAVFVTYKKSQVATRSLCADTWVFSTQRAVRIRMYVCMYACMCCKFPAANT